ncbi:triosephosphate isomerase [Ignicoccus islandicus DSM 13165]|uniref:Triosephosphate isomerase n=1 Tax=Ignicoccus islandicus DSM 13165 TaxID=940295 RepID=A0A0U2U7F3_9CREN|nr:triose-phosphate isomerase [Ignicoccus islandicus]ALU12052.1 triosephosphate isomerase [Ignicoccus islandicus DSM 13165]
MKPIIAVNAKAYYPHSFGSSLLKILRALDKIAIEYNVETILAPPFTELKEARLASERTKIYAQHVDEVDPGAVTGRIPVEGIKDIVHGSIVNHSERQLTLSAIHQVIAKLKNYGLDSLVCTPRPETAAAVSLLNPSMVAMEPPELIGTGISVSKAKPELITETIEQVRKTGFTGPILVGAGISSGEDVRKALELGAQGVLVASAVVKAKDPYEKLREFAGAIK